MTWPWELLAARVAEPPPEAAFDWAPTHAEQEMLDRLGYEKSQFFPSRWVVLGSPHPKYGRSALVTIDRLSTRSWAASGTWNGYKADGPVFDSLLALLSWLEIEGVRHG